MTDDQKEFLLKAAAAATQAGHVFPEMAACEAALESGFGKSGLATLDNNLFGMKQHKHPIFGTHVLPTKEFMNGQWEVVDAAWVHYPDQASCFADRMSTLQRLASVYPHYANALNATDRDTYIQEVSKTWSTDPERAAKVQAIYDEITADWDANPSTANA
jgi:flagellum-specific peptidoglycan hydrolase FlgJ